VRLNCGKSSRYRLLHASRILFVAISVDLTALATVAGAIPASAHASVHPHRRSLLTASSCPVFPPQPPRDLTRRYQVASPVTRPQCEI